jgi:hypothetical protein
MKMNVFIFAVAALFGLNGVAFGTTCSNCNPPLTCDEGYHSNCTCVSDKQKERPCPQVCSRLCQGCKILGPKLITGQANSTTATTAIALVHQ